MAKFFIPAGSEGTWTAPSDGGFLIEVENGETEPPNPPDGEELDLRKYGAIGDGAADDTDAVQQACDDSANGMGTVVGHETDVYLLRHRGTKPFLNIQSRFCVELRDNTRIDGRGCEFKLGGAEDAYMFTNADQENGTRYVALRNFELNGHRREQFSGAGQTPPSSAQEHGGIGVYNIERWTIEDIHAWNISMYAGRFWHSRNCAFRRLTCDGSNGDAWSFGQDAISKGPKECRNSVIEDIWAKNCEQAVANKQGNPVIGTVVDCTIKGKVGGENCSGGIKWQGRSKNSTFEICRFTGGELRTANSGTKLQGNQNSSNQIDWVQGLVIDWVESDNCAAEGLRFSHAIDCRVKKYFGQNCGQLEGQPEIVFREVCHNCRVDSINSTAAKGHVVECRKEDAVNPTVGKLVSNGCTTDVVSNASKKAVLIIDEMECRSTVGRHAKASGGGKVVIKFLRADRAQDTSGNVVVERFELL